MLLNQASNRTAVTQFEQLCARLMLLLLDCKCGGKEHRSDARLSNKRANLLDTIEVRCLALDLCETVERATHLPRTYAASVVTAHLETVQREAFCATIRWQPFARICRALYAQAFPAVTAA